MKIKRPLQEQVIVITGATSGAGRAAAIAFAGRRAKLVLAARNEQGLAEVRAECEGMGQKYLLCRLIQAIQGRDCIGQCGKRLAGQHRRLDQ